MSQHQGQAQPRDGKTLRQNPQTAQAHAGSIWASIGSKAAMMECSPPDISSMV